MTAWAALRGGRLPFFYGWVIVGAAFITMGLAVNARTAFSLLLPPILNEFGWPRSLTAGAFSFGFLVSAMVSPFLGWLMDRWGPRVVLEVGVGLLATGLILAPLVAEPWHLYATLGVLVAGGTNALGYTGHALFLPSWFERRRGFAMSLAFSGVGAGSIALLPWLQEVIERDGWRTACATTGVLVLVLLAPLNLVHRRRPEDLGLEPDGGGARRGSVADNIVDPVWAAVDWTLGRAVRTARFWWIATGYLCGMFAWYAVQVHQTRYLMETGVSATDAAWALGLVSLVAVPGQIALGHLSDRIGREWVWTIGCVGFGLCYLALILLSCGPSPALLYLMVACQGMLGYGLVSVIGAIPAEIFAGRHYGAIYGSVMLAAIGGGALGPFMTGVIYDSVGSYAPAFWLALGTCGLSAVAIWRAAPREVRAVAGRDPARMKRRAVTTAMDDATRGFGSGLRWWRERRGFSQLDLAGAAETTQRHLSFLESGRASPSREMILRLAAVLDLPLRQQNALLLAAGFAPAWRESDLSAPELAQVNSALDYMLAQQEPYPAFVVDRRWTLLRANAGAGHLVEFLTGPTPPSAAPAESVNLAVALVSPDGLRPYIVNWEEVALYFLRGVQADAIADGTRQTAQLLARLFTVPGLPALSRIPSPSDPRAPVLTIHFKRDDTSLRLFNTIATLGTPHDVTLQEIRVECFFPTDEETARMFRRWALPGSPAGDRPTQDG